MEDRIEQDGIRATTKQKLFEL